MLYFRDEYSCSGFLSIDIVKCYGQKATCGGKGSFHFIVVRAPSVTGRNQGRNSKQKLGGRN